MLTTETLDQALARSEPAGGHNVGEEAAAVAIEMVHHVRSRKDPLLAVDGSAVLDLRVSSERPGTLATMQVTVLGAGRGGRRSPRCGAAHTTMLWARSRRRPPRSTASTPTSRTSPASSCPTPHGDRRPGEGDAPRRAARRRRADHGDALDDRDAKEWIHPWIPVVSLAKGLEQGTLLRMTEVIAEELPGHPIAALTGPNIAQEIMAGQAAASVIATEDLSVAAAIQGVLTRGMFRIYTNHDVVGCELGGALKNVVAIACGIAQGLGVGDNTRSAVMTRGLAELTRLGVAMGGEAATFAGLAGMGDLVTTCISPYSRNRHGRRAARRPHARGDHWPR